MKIHSILFPTDFSSCNEAALKLASSLAAESQAKLYIVHVYDVQNLSTAMGEAAYLYESQWKEELLDAQKRLSKVIPTSAGVAYQHESLTGSPVPELLDFAEKHNVDLIVMGSHGRTGLSRLLLGSIAEGVMRRAKCPVMVVKQPAREPEANGNRAAQVVESSSR